MTTHWRFDKETTATTPTKRTAASTATTTPTSETSNQYCEQVHLSVLGLR